jgi:hypothetical protein
MSNHIVDEASGLSNADRALDGLPVLNYPYVFLVVFLPFFLFLFFFIMIKNATLV